MRLSKCAVCDSKISKFVKDQEASGLLSSLGIKSFKYNSYIMFSFVYYTYSACGQFTKNKERIN